MHSVVLFDYWVFSTLHKAKIRFPHQQASRRRGSRELEPHPLAPLASQDPVDQLDGVQEGNEDEEEEEEVKISPRADSPRGKLLLLRSLKHNNNQLILFIS